MRKLNLLFIILLNLIFFHTQNFAQCNEWVVTGNSPEGIAPATCYGVAADKEGNVFVAGTIDSTFGNFNNTNIENTNLQESNIIFVAKVDSTGNSIWTKNIETSAFELFYSFSSFNNEAYLTIGFQGDIYIDGQMLTSNDKSILIVKFEADGNIAWYRTYVVVTNNIQPTTWMWSPGVSIDSKGNVLVAGFFRGVMTFGSTILETTINATQRELFILKLDKDGNEIWAIQSSGSDASNIIYNRGWSITTDSNDDVIIGGLFYSEISIGSVTAKEPTGAFTPYVAKLDGETGNALWIKGSEFVDANSFGNIYGVAADKENNILAVGYADTTIEFGGVMLDSELQKSIIVTKYDTNGDLIYARNFGDEISFSGNFATNVEVDENDIVHVSGAARTGALFDNFAMERDGSFLISLDSFGTVTALKSLGSGPSGRSLTYTADYDNLGSIYTVGNYSTSENLYYTSDNNFITPEEENGIYLWKSCIENTMVSSNDITNINIPFVEVSPNPNDGSFNLKINSIDFLQTEINILNQVGKVVQSQKINLAKGDNSFLIELSTAFASGTYFIHVKTNNQSITKKIIKF